MLKTLTILLFLPLISLAQQTVGLFSNQPNSYNGYTLFNSIGSQSTYLIDNCGVKVHEWNSNHPPAGSVYLLNDGNLLRTARPQNTSFSFGGSGGEIEILDPNSNVIWSYGVNSDSTLSHHDLEVLPNGNILILAIEFISAQEANELGSVFDADRYSEMILEVNPSTSEIVWEWHAWDHLIQDTDPDLPSYGVISENPGRININYAFDGTDPDWLHANSIDYNPDLDQIIINTPTFSEFWIIDHNTTTEESAGSAGGFSGNGGDILYRWGNPQSYNRGDSLDQVFEFQHDAHWISSGLPNEGKIMIFNNGDTRKYSSIDIIEAPLDSSNFNNYLLPNNSNSYGPQDLFWTYSDSANFYSRRISGAQQLQNGNILICSGFQSRLFEIEFQTDSVVWDYIIPVNSVSPITQGQASVGNFNFRAHKFSLSYSGFNNLELTPSTVIELDPLPSTCQIYISGCMESLACNYDPSANVSDSSCVYPQFFQQSVSICDGDNIVVGTSIYSAAGTYSDTLILSNGCDSIVSTDLLIDYNTSSYDTLSTSSSIVWNDMILDIEGDYSDTLMNFAGCDSVINLNLTIINTTSILNFNNTKRTLVRITDILGQETPFRRNIPLFYIYDDGTVEKKIILE